MVAWGKHSVAEEPRRNPGSVPTQTTSMKKGLKGGDVFCCFVYDSGFQALSSPPDPDKQQLPWIQDLIRLHCLVSLFHTPPLKVIPYFILSSFSHADLMNPSRERLFCKI
ncbi:unnamed protein product [Arctogadus glacialis]